MTAVFIRKKQEQHVQGGYFNFIHFIGLVGLYIGLVSHHTLFAFLS